MCCLLRRMYYKGFIEHPESVNETYCEHWYEAMYISTKLGLYSFYECVHAMIPGIDFFHIQNTTSVDKIQEICDYINDRQNETNNSTVKSD